MYRNHRIQLQGLLFARHCRLFICATWCDEYYHTNYCYNGVSYDQLMEIVPVLKVCKIGVVNHLAPEGWKAIYLGFGNHLTIKADYYDKFEEETRNRHIEEAVELYQQWSGIVLKCINNHA